MEVQVQKRQSYLSCLDMPLCCSGSSNLEKQRAASPKSIRSSAPNSANGRFDASGYITSKKTQEIYTEKWVEQDHRVIASNVH